MAFFAYSPGIELRKANGYMHIELRQAVDNGPDCLLITHSIIQIAMSNEEEQLLRTIALNLLSIDGIGNLVGQVMDAHQGRGVLD